MTKYNMRVLSATIVFLTTLCLVARCSETDVNDATIALTPAVLYAGSTHNQEELRPGKGQQLAVLEVHLSGESGRGALPRGALFAGKRMFVPGLNLRGSIVPSSSDSAHKSLRESRESASSRLMLFVVPDDLKGPFFYAMEDGTEIELSEIHRYENPLKLRHEESKRRWHPRFSTVPETVTLKADRITWQVTPVRCELSSRPGTQLTRIIKPKERGMLGLSLLIMEGGDESPPRVIRAGEIALCDAGVLFPCLYRFADNDWGPANAFPAMSGAVLLFNVPADIESFDICYGGEARGKLSVPADLPSVDSSTSGIARCPLQQMNQKLDTIILSEVSFPRLAPWQALRFLEDKAREKDNSGQGVNVIVGPGRLDDGMLSLVGKDMSLRSAYQHLAKATGRNLVIEPYAILLQKGGMPHGLELDGTERSPQTRQTRLKLHYLILPRIVGANASLEQLLNLVQKNAKTIDPSGVGVKIRAPRATVDGKKTTGESGSSAGFFADEDFDTFPEMFSKGIDISLTNTPLGDTLRYICFLSGTQFRITGKGIDIVDTNSQ